MVHELKTWPEPFAGILAGRKRYEIRKNDRGYAVGHELHLREWDPSTEEYSGRSVHCEVIHITDGGEFGLPEDMCAMGILRLDS